MAGAGRPRNGGGSAWGISAGVGGVTTSTGLSTNISLITSIGLSMYTSLITSIGFSTTTSLIISLGGC